MAALFSTPSFYTLLCLAMTLNTISRKMGLAIVAPIHMEVQNQSDGENFHICTCWIIDDSPLRWCAIHFCWLTLSLSPSLFLCHSHSPSLSPSLSLSFFLSISPAADLLHEIHRFPKCTFLVLTSTAVILLGMDIAGSEEPKIFFSRAWLCSP